MVPCLSSRSLAQACLVAPRQSPTCSKRQLVLEKATFFLARTHCRFCVSRASPPPSLLHSICLPSAFYCSLPHPVLPLSHPPPLSRSRLPPIPERLDSSSPVISRLRLDISINLSVLTSSFDLQLSLLLRPLVHSPVGNRPVTHLGSSLQIVSDDSTKTTHLCHRVSPSHH